MAPKVFLTGATGYIGGSVLNAVHKAHPDYEFTLFVRNEQRAKAVSAEYPGVKFVYGSLDDAPVIEKAAAEADIVIHTADSADSVPAAQAIAKGLAAGHTPEKPGYWIHLSGTGILTWYDPAHNRVGEAPLPEQTYNDLDGVDRLLNLPDEAIHRDVDKIVQRAAASKAIRALIVAPPTIYGTGHGPVNTTSIQVPGLAEAAFRLGYVPVIGAGETEWDNVHIDDLADLFARFVDATQDPGKRDDPEVFGPRAYFFARQDEHRWADVAAWIAEEAAHQGYLPEAATKSVSLETVEKTKILAAPTWGSNSKGEALRANKFLGWRPKSVPLRDTIPEVVRQAAAKVEGVVPKYK